MTLTASTTDSFTDGLRIAVIGGGITGLAAAHHLAMANADLQVTLFESSRRLGGIIRTEEADEFLMELGPDSFITNKPGGIQLCEELGFADQLISTDTRYRKSLVLSRGRPRAVPDGFMLMSPEKPLAILTTPILSLKGRLRLLGEYFVRSAGAQDDESLASFVRRRFGAETLDRLVQPLVGGIYTSDPEKLSLRATLPRFLDMEQQHGGIIRAVLAASSSKQKQASRIAEAGARYGLFATPSGGLSQLVSAIEQKLAGCPGFTLRLNSPVQNLQQDTQQDQTAWLLETFAGRQTFDAVIVTLPTHAAARLLSDDSFADLRQELQQVEYASSALVISGHQLSDFRDRMEAFGMVVPAVENREILAVSYASRKFPNRAPAGHILLRTFVGGAMQPELLDREDDEILDSVERELQGIYGLHRAPLFAEVIRYQRAMPQYHVGHISRVLRIEDQLKKFSGLQLAGSSYYGVGIPDSISSGRSAAETILQSLAADQADPPR